MSKNSYHVIVHVVLLLIILFNLGSTIWQQKEKYTSHNYWQRFPNLKQTYLDSQYVNKHPKGWIPDEIVLSYAGGEYIKGINPVLIISDTPPLGKYLIGVSIVLFNNEHIITLITVIFSLVLLYLVGIQIYKNSLFAMLPPFLYSLEPILKNQLIFTPLLDVFQLLFLLLSFYFFNTALSRKKYLIFFILANISLGLFISTKFFATGITIIAAWIITLLYNQNGKAIKYLIITIPVSVFILLASYIRVFVFGYQINKFLGIQKWVLLYHKSQLILPFSIWPLLLLDKWYVWWGNVPILSEVQWRITWPIITIMSFFVICIYVFKKIKKNIYIEVAMIWVVTYILFFSVGQIAARYLVIYIPILYLIAIFGLQNFLRHKFHKLYKYLL